MEITKGNGDMEMVRLRAAGKSQVEIYSFGAHLTSWVDANGNEKIYTSPTALYNGEKAIRGGIPICFPQFAKRGPLKQHGFARTALWTIDRPFLTSGQRAVKFILSDTDDTRRGAWPYKFEVSAIFRLSADGNKLSLELDIMNKDEEPFTFTIALHSYFTCPSEDVVLTEYDNLMYMDNTDGLKEKQQKGSVTFGKEVDRVYVSSSDKLSIRKADLSIEKMNLPDVVVWNPYKEKAAALSDMPDDDWRSFICIEPARIASPATVHPAETWTCSLMLSVS